MKRHVSIRHRRTRQFMAVLIIGMVTLLSLIGCQNRELSPDDGCNTPRGSVPVQVIITWALPDGEPLPKQGMRIHLFNTAGAMAEIDDVEATGGALNLPLGAQYYPVCYNYYDLETIDFRNTENRQTFEAFLPPVPDGSRNTVRGDEVETIVQEPDPGYFYCMGDTLIWTVELPNDGSNIVRLDCYPVNVLREFTFMVEDVIGTENIGSARGMISGMPENYRPAFNRSGDTRATIRFTRCHANPTTKGGYGTLSGAFCTFAPNAEQLTDNEFTVEILGMDGKVYSGVWDSAVVSSQMQQAMKLGEEWRNQNGGYDIVLKNEGRLNIPEPPAGGLAPDVGDWDNVNVPL